MHQRLLFALALCSFAAVACPSQAQPAPAPWQDPANWSHIPPPTATRDIVYLTASGQDQHLDVYEPSGTGSKPVLIYFHGGGWTNGNRPQGWTGARAWIAAGFSVVNVDYRLRDTATAPAAVQDARCALAWVKANAAKFHFDLKRVVTYGTSAGGHLALMDGMLPLDNDIDLPNCKDQPKVAAILDFYGVYILDPAIPGAYKGTTKSWIGPVPDPTAMEHKMSPQSYLRKGLPPVFIAHGDADPTVPYIASVTLHSDLDRFAIPNQFVTVPGGLHGKWTPEENQRVQLESLKFLQAQGIIP